MKITTNNAEPTISLQSIYGRSFFNANHLSPRLVVELWYYPVHQKHLVSILHLAFFRTVMTSPGFSLPSPQFPELLSCSPTSHRPEVCVRWFVQTPPLPLMRIGVRRCSLHRYITSHPYPGRLSKLRIEYRLKCLRTFSADIPNLGHDVTLGRPSSCLSREKSAALINWWGSRLPTKTFTSSSKLGFHIKATLLNGDFVRSFVSRMFSNRVHWPRLPVTAVGVAIDSEVR